MTDLLWFLFSVTGVVAITFGFACWLLLRPASRRARGGLLLVTLLYAAASVFGVSYLFERVLLRGFHPFAVTDLPAGPTAIVILGSGSFTARDWDGGEYTIVDAAAAERVREALRVYQLTGASWLITSGGRVHPDNPNVPTGIAMRRALLELGVPESRLLTLADARNTFEEARALAPVLGTLGVEHVVLVTSARHMRRAVGTFRAAGVSVVPAIARNTALDLPWSHWWLPSDSGLWEAGSVAHEYLGIAAYAAQRKFAF